MERVAQGLFCITFKELKKLRGEIKELTEERRKLQRMFHFMQAVKKFHLTFNSSNLLMYKTKDKDFAVFITKKQSKQFDLKEYGVNTVDPFVKTKILFVV